MAIQLSSTAKRSQLRMEQPSLIDHPVSQAWLESFSKRKDVRRLSAALKKATDAKKNISEDAVWEALAACEIIACLQGKSNPKIGKEFGAWAKKKGANEKLVLQARRTLERLPLSYRFENSQAELLADLFKSLALGISAANSCDPKPVEATKVEAKVIPLKKDVSSDEDIGIPIDPEARTSPKAPIAPERLEVARPSINSSELPHQPEKVAQHIDAQEVPPACVEAPQSDDANLQTSPKRPIPELILGRRHEDSILTRKVPFQNPESPLPDLHSMRTSTSPLVSVTLDLSHAYEYKHFERLARLLPDWDNIELHLKLGPEPREIDWLKNELAPLALCKRLRVTEETGNLRRGGLELLSCFPDTETLRLKADSASLGTLAKLSKLSELHLEGDFSDAELVSQLPLLKKLSLEQTTLTNRTISSLPRHLRSLALISAKLDETPTFGHLDKLLDLTISEVAEAKSLTFLYDIPQLERFSVYGLHHISDLSPLISLDGLRYMSLRFLNGLSDISALANLVSLETFIGAGLSKVKYLPSFARLINLRRLHLEMFTELRDYSPLTQAPNLQELVIGFTHQALKVSDLQFLADHHSLQKFELRNTYREQLSHEINSLVNLPAPLEHTWQTQFSP